MKRIGVICILILAFAGLADSVYLTQHKLNGTPLICNIQSLSGCNVVAESPYSKIFGVPLSEFGILFYSIVFILAALELVIFDRVVRRVLQVASLVGVLASIYFTALQIFFIGAFCIYCIASAIITLLVFVFATLIEPLRKQAVPVSVAEDVNREVPKPLHLSMPPKN